MTGFLIRVLISAAGLWIADALLDGISFRDDYALLWAALWLGVVNAIVRPVVVVLTFPITLLTLGLFLLLVNAGMLALVARLLEGFTLTGFFPAFFGAIIVSLTSWLASSYIGPRGRVELLVVERG